MSAPKTVNDRRPNFRDEDGDLYLVRCFACAPNFGKDRPEGEE